jgi:hypothetical protein
MKRKLTMFLGVIALAVIGSLSTPAVSQGYICPPGVPLCQKASQCVTFCGGTQFAACYHGCCLCSG